MGGQNGLSEDLVRLEGIMDTSSEELYELNNLVIICFGQECDILDEDYDFDNLLNEYLNTSSEFSLRMLLANLIELNGQADRNEVLMARYNAEFAPDRWELTTQQGDIFILTIT